MLVAIERLLCAFMFMIRNGISLSYRRKSMYDT
jgi:hypothetical protein